MHRQTPAERRQSVLCFTLMAVWFALAWAVVFVFKLGPVIADVDARAGRGIHSGDLLAVPLVAMGLLLYGKGWALEHRPGRMATAA